MPTTIRKLLVPAGVILLLVALGVVVALRLIQERQPVEHDEPSSIVPVEVAAIERGSIEDQRTFSGTLVPRAKFIVAPKVGGRVESLNVDVGDPVSPGDVVAHLDDAEFVQALAQARADVEVANANLAQSLSLLEIARREYERVQTLLERNIASESAVDVVRADLRAKEAQVQVAQAQLERAQAQVATQQVRLGYTQVKAQWTDPQQDQRVVSERFVDEGATVAANDPLVTVVDLSPVRALLFITERDYGRLEVGQPAYISADAYPGETFEGRVLRLAPVFEAASRQARVEVEIPNEDRRLKPGMYVRVSVVLAREPDAVIVGSGALVRRDGGTSVFVVDESGRRVRQVPVTLGIVAGDRVQVIGEGLTGRVVTLGQQLLDDGSEIRIVDAPAPASRSVTPAQTRPQTPRPPEAGE